MNQNFSFKQKIVAVFLAIIALFGGGYTATNLGGVQDGQAYNSTTTYIGNGTPTINGGHRSLKTNLGGTLGTVDISGGAVAGRMVFWDATSTTDTASTTLLVIPASAAAMSHPYDIAFSRGLVIETVTGLVPTTTITWR